jgi:hypothetical protein
VKPLALAFALLLLSACSEGSVDTDDPVAPANAAGTFKGPFTSSRNPGTHEATLILTQAGRNVSGTFVSNENNATFQVSGEVTGTKLMAQFGRGGNCVANTEAEIDITQNGTVLVGTYVTTDCVGQYSGAFTLTKQ